MSDSINNEPGCRIDEPDDRDYILVDTLERLEEELAKLQQQGIHLGIWKPYRDKNGEPRNYEIETYKIPKKRMPIEPEALIVPLKPSISDDTKKITLNLPSKYSLYKGLFNYALVFNGIDSYAVLPKEKAQNINFEKNQDFTIELWVKADLRQADIQDEYNSILEKWDGDSKKGYPYAIRYDNSSNKIVCSRYDGAYNTPLLISKTAINDGEIHHIVFAKNSSNLYLYIDGRMQDRKIDTTHDNNSLFCKTSNDSDVYLGSRGSQNANSNKIATNYFKGKVNGIFIWDKALPEECIISRGKDFVKDIKKDFKIFSITRLEDLQFDLSQKDLVDIFTEEILSKITQELQCLSQELQCFSEFISDLSGDKKSIAKEIAQDILNEGLIDFNTIYEYFSYGIIKIINQRINIDNNYKDYIHNKIKSRSKEIAHKTLEKVCNKLKYYGKFQLCNFDNWSMVKNQNGIPTCVTHAAVSLLEYFERKASGIYQDYSRLFLYNVASKLSHRNKYKIYKKELSIREVMAAMITFGVPREEYYPYPKKSDVELEKGKIDSIITTIERKVSENFSLPFVYNIAQKYKAKSYFRLDQLSIKNKRDLLDQIKIFIYTGFPAMFGFKIIDESEMGDAKNNGGKFAFPKSFDKCEIDGAFVNHAAVAVGYDDKYEITTTCKNSDQYEILKKAIEDRIPEEYREKFIKIDNHRYEVITTGAFLIRNGLGENWGDKGYGWLPYAYVLACLAFDWWSMLTAKWFDTDYFGLSNRDEGLGKNRNLTGRNPNT